MVIATVNPYWGKNFFSFLILFFSRFLEWITGRLSLDQLASDEIQVLVLIGVALSSSLVGVFLVLKKMTMLANSLSHTILLGIILTYLLLHAFFSSENPSVSLIGLKQVFIAALITGAITTFFTQILTQVVKLQEDASIGLVFTTLFALGIVIVTIFTRNSHIGIEAVMGNVDALHFDDLKMVSFIVLVNAVIITLFFKEFQLIAFDGALGQSLGFSPSFFNYLLMIQVALTAIAAFRAVGVLLVLALLVGPVLCARLLTNSLRNLILLSAAIGSLCSLFAVALSRHLLSVYQMSLSTAGLVVVLIAIAYLFLILRGVLFSSLRRMDWKKTPEQIDI